MKIPLFSKSGTLRAKEASAERCVNWYPEKGGKDEFYLKPTPGLGLFVTPAPPIGSGVRGLYTSSSNRMFAVCGNTLFEISIAGVATSRGTLGISWGRVSMVDNGTELIIADGVNAKGWILNLDTNVFTQITDIDYPAGYTVEFQDTYFIMAKPNTNEFYISGNNDGFTWSTLDKTSVQGSPDRLVTVIRNGRDLWAIGERSTEVYYNSGNSAFPFDVIQGSESEIGCASRWSVSQIDNHVFWLGANGEGKGVVWMSNGYAPVRISTHAVEFSLSDMSLINDCESFTYQSEGHVFYVMSFQTGKKTWVYDLTTGEWHERMYWDSVGAQEKRHLASTQTFFNGKVYVGGFTDNNIYELSETVYTDNGDSIIRIGQTSNIHAERKRMFFHQLRLDVERGVGLITGQGSDPQIMMQWSSDGGHTWSNEHWESAGKIGAYNERVRWNNLGQDRSRSFRFKTSDPVNFTLIACYADVSLGNG